jgi:putative tryptophan/tyrosine transport system substrate-binding protein
MRRRDFITGVAGSTMAWPLIARAQQSAMPVIGFLNGGSPDGFAANVKAFHQGLREASYIDGQNVAIEYRWANGQYDRLAALADDLVRGQASVIVANTPGNLFAKAATTTIPIVFTTTGDPVKLGLVASLDRPGGNVTGVTQLGAEIAPKRLELLHELIPGATSFALLVNPTGRTFTEGGSREIESAARRLGLLLHVLQASDERELDGVFTNLAQLGAGGLVINADPFFTSHAGQLAAQALRHSVPTIYVEHEFVAAGGLASYGGNVPESYRLAGAYAGHILKGEKPADLPVQQSTKIELFINLKTAKALGITVPQTLLVAADEVIE